MKFIDEATIDLAAGDGGSGCASFRREKFVARGGPNGGDGGRGGNIIFRTDEGLSTLMDVRYHRHYKAGSGKGGMGKQMNGAHGEDRVVRVPVGTVVLDAGTMEKLADLDKPGADWIAAKGGSGGRGNIHFATATHQTPREYEVGRPGVKRKLRLELKLMADVGLLGFPNAGKSTLISAISNARPKIADYPFTTKVPNLGLVRISMGESFVVADIPGLIEGASQGAGMGIKFLKHVERTRILIHLVDVTDPTQTDPLAAYLAIRRELEAYSEELAQRPEIIILTKMDLPDARDVRDEVEKRFHDELGLSVLAISAPTHDGLKKMLMEIWNKLQAVKASDAAAAEQTDLQRR
jgi:GTPase